MGTTMSSEPIHFNPDYMSGVRPHPGGQINNPSRGNYGRGHARSGFQHDLPDMLVAHPNQHWEESDSYGDSDSSSGSGSSSSDREEPVEKSSVPINRGLKGFDLFKTRVGSCLPPSDDTAGKPTPPGGSAAPQSMDAINSASTRNGVLQETITVGAPIPKPPPLPPKGILKKHASQQSNISTDAENGNVAESLPTLEDKWDVVKEGFDDVIAIMKECRQEYLFNGLLIEMDKTLNRPYGIFSHKEERLKIGDYLATETNFAEVLVTLYKDLMKAKGHTNYTVLSNDNPSEVVLQVLRALMWNYSDISLKLAKKFTDTGIIASLISDVEVMEEMVLSPVFKVVGNAPILSAFGVIHNCAKVPNMKMLFHDLNAVDVIFPYVKSQNEVVKATAVMILAYIIDDEKNDLLLADQGVFDFTIFTLKKALSSPDRRADGFSSQELAEGLTGMAKNDTNKVLIVERGGLKPLTVMLEKGDIQEKTTAAEAIWTLAFKEENRVKIREDTSIIPLLQDLKKHENARLRKRCEGALWEIEEKYLTTKDEALKGALKTSGFGSFGGAPSQRPQHVMISYNWAHQDTVKQISKALQSEGYKVWLDIENMEGSTLQAMAEAVENACVILVCISEEYKDSSNCRSEAEYAYRMNKEIIPLMLQAKYRPDGWLGLILGTKLYYNFSGTRQFDKVLGDLIKALGQKGKAEKHFSSFTPTVPAKVTTEKAQPVGSSPFSVGFKKDPVCSQWSESDVRNWLEKNNVPLLPKLSTLTGKHVAFLKKMSRQAPEYFYHFLEHNLGLTDLDSLMKFSEAVESIT